MRGLCTVILAFVLFGVVMHGVVQAAESPTAFYVDKLRLVYGREGWDMKFPIDPSREHIYGVSYEARGTPGSIVKPGHYWTLRADGSERQEKTWINWNYGSFRIDVDDTWQMGRIEIFTKKGASWLVLTMGVQGSGKVQVRNVRLKEGGFPENPPVRGAPYLKWINSLKPNRDYAKANPLLKFDNSGAGLFFSWHRDIQLPDGDVKLLQEQIKPYMEIPIKKLVQLMPERRPFYFGERYYHWYFYCVIWKYEKREYRWDPREPDVLRKQDGTIFDFAAKYPITGYEEVTAPSGKVFKYPYHDPSGEKDQSASGKNRVYLDKFMTTVRVNELCRAAYSMAGLYRKTGNRDYALRSAAILWSWARAIRDWPIYGQIGSGEKPQSARFWPPDTYEHWFAFITGTWYTSAMRGFVWPARNYDLIREAPVWDELSKVMGHDTQHDVENSLLYTAKMGLKFDAYYRTNEWKFYHNTIGAQIKAFIEIGRALGCPELMHYVVNKTDGAFHAYFLASGMSPECPGYLGMIAGSLGNAFVIAEGYSDPPGYVAAIDGKHIESYDLRKLSPVYDNARMYMDRLRFPDGFMVPIHDTGAGPSSSLHGTTVIPREEVFPFLLPEYGHGILGWGKKPNRIEAHLHYSGSYNHRHDDMLNFILWAYGDELTADIGYAGSYGVATTSHNLVVVDGKNQLRQIPRGDLLAWYPQIDAVQAVQASGPHAYKNVDLDIYRRAIVAVPFTGGKDAIVDIFEVEGGEKRHEWMTNGCANYIQKLETNLVVVKELDNLAEDGKAVDPTGDQKIQYSSGKKSPFYGAFSNVRIAEGFYSSENRAHWHVTMTAKASVSKDTSGAGTEAKSKGQKPGLRLNWLSPLDGEVILCEAPRSHRGRWREKDQVARAKDPMCKVILRRDDISSTFVAVWEPFKEQPWLQKIDLLKEVSQDEGIGVMLQSEKQRAIVLYRKPESKSTLKAVGVSSNGHFTILREKESETMLDLYGGTEVTAGPVKAELSGFTAMPVLSLEEESGKHYFLIKGDLTGYPGEVSKQPHAGRFVKFAQEGQVSRWLPVEHIEKKNGEAWRVFLSRDPGFTFDAKRKFLRDLFFPHRSLRGAAAIVLPDWLNLKWRLLSGGGARLKVRSSGKLRLRISGLRNVTKAKVRSEPSTTLIDVPVKVTAEEVILELSPRTLGSGWWDIALGDDAIAECE